MQLSAWIVACDGLYDSTLFTWYVIIQFNGMKRMAGDKIPIVLIKKLKKKKKKKKLSIVYHKDNEFSNVNASHLTITK